MSATEASPMLRSNPLKTRSLQFWFIVLASVLSLLPWFAFVAFPAKLSHPLEIRREDRPEGLPFCKNAIIFTGARQGSTWFVDSVERCRYSTMNSQHGSRQFSEDVFKKTELWKHFGEKYMPGGELDAAGALRYISRNSSVKIFPSAFWRRRKDIAVMLRRREEFNLTVLVLRRDVEAAWRSWSRAAANQVWNGVGENAAVWDEDEYRYFKESRERYDSRVEEKILSRPNVDVFDYDEIKGMEWIVARENGCVIRNCNFV